MAAPPFATSLSSVDAAKRTGRGFVAAPSTSSSNIFGSAPASSPGGRRKFPTGPVYEPMDAPPVEQPAPRIVNGRIVRGGVSVSPAPEAFPGGGSYADVAPPMGGRATGVTGSSNAFARGASQNTGNVLTDRPTSRVLAVPGGSSSISLAWAAEPSVPFSHQRNMAKGGSALSYDDSAAAVGENVDAYGSAAATTYGGGGGYEAAADIALPMGGRATGVTGSSNAFARGASQNTGNVLTDRPTSRVLAAPGGGSSISLSWAADEPIGLSQSKAVGGRGAQQQAHSPKFDAYQGGGGGYESAAAAASMGGRATGVSSSSNAFARGASQNTGNVLTDRPTSRVLAAPGGHSTLRLG